MSVTEYREPRSGCPLVRKPDGLFAPHPSATPEEIRAFNAVLNTYSPIMQTPDSAEKAAEFGAKLIENIKVGGIITMEPCGPPAMYHFGEIAGTPHGWSNTETPADAPSPPGMYQHQCCFIDRSGVRCLVEACFDCQDSNPLGRPAVCACSAHLADMVQDGDTVHRLIVASWSESRSDLAADIEAVRRQLLAGTDCEPLAVRHADVELADRARAEAEKYFQGLRSKAQQKPVERTNPAGKGFFAAEDWRNE